MRPVPLQRVGDYIVKMYEFEEDVCQQLLARGRFGRVGFSDDAKPTILPVNCLFSRGAVLFRIEAGSALDRMLDGTVVAFEADHIDPIAESGWSVLVRGTAFHVTDPQRITSLAETEVHPWAPGRRDRWVEIRPAQITGRVIQRHRYVDDGERVPYMSPG